MARKSVRGVTLDMYKWGGEADTAPQQATRAECFPNPQAHLTRNDALVGVEVKLRHTVHLQCLLLQLPALLARDDIQTISWAPYVYQDRAAVLGLGRG